MIDPARAYAASKHSLPRIARITRISVLISNPAEWLKNTDLEVLKAAIRAMLERLIRLNQTRADFGEKFEELIESYNNGSRNIEELFSELVTLSRALSDEQQRHVRENMTEEELVIFDILSPGYAFGAHGSLLSCER